MQFAEWKDKLVADVVTAAEWCAERSQGVRDDPQNLESQRALFDLAGAIRTLPDDHDKLQALFEEESAIAGIENADADEPEARYQEARGELLRSIGFGHEPFADADAFLDVLRARADETVTEYRLR